MLNTFIIFINYIISIIGTVIGFLIGVLPKSPFSVISNTSISAYLGTLNFFVPIAEMIFFMQYWLLAIGSLYLYQIVMRWIKAIG